MSKPETPPPKTITITEAELEAIKSRAAADAAVHLQRGNAAEEGMTMSQERRVAQITGQPIPERRPWPTLRATFSIELPDWAGAVTGTAEFKQRTSDEDGRPLDPPRVTTLRLIDLKFPPLSALQSKHKNFDDKATFAPEGYGKRRPDIKEGAYFTREFLQYVIKDVYETPISAMFANKDLKFIKPYLTSELRPVDLGEIRRETSYSGRHAAE